MAVNLLARTFGFDTKIDKSGRKLKTFGRTARNVGKGLKGFGGFALAAGGIGGLGFFIKSQLTAIDLLGKTSDKLGISTEDLGAFQHTARLSGVEVRTLNIGLQRMTRRMSEAAKGGGEAQAAIKELGLDAKFLNTAGTAETFRQIEKAFEGIGNQSDKVRLAFKLFDAEGVSIMNLFATGIGRIQGQYRKLGLELSRGDVKTIENINDELTKITAQITQQGRLLLIDVGPTVLDAVKGATILLEGMGILRKTPNALEVVRANKRKELTGQAAPISKLDAVAQFAGRYLAYYDGSRGERNRQRIFRQQVGAQQTSQEAAGLLINPDIERTAIATEKLVALVEGKPEIETAAN